MGDKSKIEWTDSSWTPIRARRDISIVMATEGSAPEALSSGTHTGWHCEHVTEACRNCYAETMNKRLGTGLEFRRQDRDAVEIFLDEKMLTAPLHWKKPRKIFVCSMTDLFAEFVPDAMIDKMFAVMALCPQHTFQVLTKRPERMQEYILSVAVRGAQETISPEGNLIEEAFGMDRAFRAPRIGWPLPNVWKGVSVHDQPSADEFIPILLDTPAAMRFISYEPALGPVNLERLRPPGYTWLDVLSGRAHEGPGTSQGHPRLDWVIAGGESGPHARPAHPDWFRSVRDQCAAAGVPFFFKQWGEWKPYQRVGKKRAGRLLDGVTHDGFPAP